MNLDYINLDYLTEVQRTIEGLADVKVSFYDGRGRLLLPPGTEDSLLSLITATERGKEDYERFTFNTIQTAVKRKEPTIAEAPSGQHLFFIPAHVKDKSLVLVGGAFYLSSDDFMDVSSSLLTRYDLSHEQLDEASRQILIMDYEKIQNMSFYIQGLFSCSVRQGYEFVCYKRKYNRTKTILRLLLNMQEDISPSGIYALLADMLIFLFYVDSMSIMAEDKDGFEPVFLSGKIEDSKDFLTFRKDVSIISETFRKKSPLFCDDPLLIKDLCMEEEQIESLHLFPCFIQDRECQLLCLFNTRISKEEEEEIFELFQHINLLLSTVSLKNQYDKRMRDMTMLNMATAGLNILYDKREDLYNSILSTAVRLSNAEKGSLMLAIGDSEELSVKAVHGINRLIVKDLKVRAGEGIAGKVFKDSVAVISSDVEKDFSVKRKPGYKTTSFMSIPLKVCEETIGVLNISDKITGEIFRDDDLALIHSFANYASIALKGSDYYTLAEQLKELSITDSLTNLYNRRYFQERLAEEVDRSERHNLNFSLCIVDIDDFKLFNDSEGHPAGDELLKKLSQLLHSSLRAIDVPARIGGEEFAIIMPQTDKDEAYFVAERIRNTVREELAQKWEYYPKSRVTVSLGISTFPVDGNNPKTLIIHSDKALYRAKMNGKDVTFTWEERSGQ